MSSRDWGEGLATDEVPRTHSIVACFTYHDGSREEIELELEPSVSPQEWITIARTAAPFAGFQSVDLHDEPRHSGLALRSASTSRPPSIGPRFALGLRTGGAYIVRGTPVELAHWYLTRNGGDYLAVPSGGRPRAAGGGPWHLRVSEPLPGSLTRLTVQASSQGEALHALCGALFEGLRRGADDNYIVAEEE